MSARDYAFEALAEVTGTDWTAGRGELNAALKSIREQTEVQDSYLLADLIHKRAGMYREVMPDVMLTPTALAKHWLRVLEESGRKNRPVSTNRSAVVTECQTCGGDRFVVVRLRKPEQTAWMRDRGIMPATDSFHEEMAPCPDCNLPAFENLRTLDPAKVRELIAR